MEKEKPPTEIAPSEAKAALAGHPGHCPWLRPERKLGAFAWSPEAARTVTPVAAAFASSMFQSVSLRSGRPNEAVTAARDAGE